DRPRRNALRLQAVEPGRRGLLLEARLEQGLELPPVPDAVARRPEPGVVDQLGDAEQRADLRPEARRATAEVYPGVLRPEGLVGRARPVAGPQALGDLARGEAGGALVDRPRDRRLQQRRVVVLA